MKHWTMGFTLGLALFGGLALSGLVAGTTPGQATTPTTPVAATAATVALPQPGQALVHTFTREDGAPCVVVLTATSSDPHPVCGPEPVASPEPATK